MRSGETGDRGYSRMNQKRLRRDIEVHAGIVVAWRDAYLPMEGWTVDIQGNQGNEIFDH